MTHLPGVPSLRSWYFTQLTFYVKNKRKLSIFITSVHACHLLSGTIFFHALARTLESWVALVFRLRPRRRGTTRSPVHACEWKQPLFSLHRHCRLCCLFLSARTRKKFACVSQSYVCCTCLYVNELRRLQLTSVCSLSIFGRNVLLALFRSFEWVSLYQHYIYWDVFWRPRGNRRLGN